MKNKFSALVGSLLFICLATEAQRPEPIKPKQGNIENGNLKIDPSKIKIADTTNIKLNKLVEEFNIMKVENKKLKEDVQELKISMTSLSMKASEMQKDNGALKILMTGADNKLGSLNKIAPLAYASFEPEKGANGGYTYKIASQYGVTGTPVQSYNSVTITLSRNVVGKPVIITAAGEDHINKSDFGKTNTVIYDFTAPNKIRLTQKGDILAPFSVVVYGTVE